MLEVISFKIPTGLLLLGLTLRLGPEPAWIFLGIGIADILWAGVHRLLWSAPRH